MLGDDESDYVDVGENAENGIGIGNIVAMETMKRVATMKNAEHPRDDDRKWLGEDQSDHWDRVRDVRLFLVPF